MLLHGDPPLVAKGTLYLVFWHLLAILFLVSFNRAVYSNPGNPQAYELQRVGPDEAVGLMAGQDGSRPIIRIPAYITRHCPVCDTLKPDRCHHCSTCNRCILKMDHHCVFLNNCVGWRNYKFFMLMLWWGMLLCALTLATLLQQLIGVKVKRA